MTSTVIAAAPDSPPPAKHSFGWQLLGVVLWPRAAFTYLREHASRSWLVVLLVVALLAVADRLVAAPIEKAQADAAIAALQAQSDAQGQGGPGGGKGTFFISNGGNTITNAPGVAGGPLLTYGLPLAGVVWDWLFRGGLLLGLAWLLGGRPAPGAMFRMSSWTLLPTAARLLVAVVFMLVAHREPVQGLQGLDAGPTNIVINGNSGGGGPTNSGPATNSGDNSGSGDKPDVQTVQVGPGGGAGGPAFLPLLRSAFLSDLDLYTLWSLVLLLIGVAVTARLGWLKSAISTIVYWGVSLALATLPPLLTFLLLTVARPGNIVGP